ncbi:type II toxin-antitoxin system VapC family toxin [Pleurocapsa sp. PCC 7319]|uniref:type II toxin-antitoxin system VapC family toxin n=1 Tax=Pleurocapsa sp. PCC 7319 TaxID=118161 RepID=UPI00034B3056|nr:PIN domain-containing protein [Pleurocapsa sp. PCC 7319]
MNQVFVDTAAWIALLNIDDVWHQKAHIVRSELVDKNYIFITTDFILLEVADALCLPIHKKNTVNFLRNIYQLKSTRVIPLNQDLFQSGLSLYEKRLDKDWGLTDCISFVVMQKEGILEAFTSDKHFEQAGFARLLKPKV